MARLPCGNRKCTIPVKALRFAATSAPQPTSTAPSAALTWYGLIRVARTGGDASRIGHGRREAGTRGPVGRLQLREPRSPPTPVFAHTATSSQTHSKQPTYE